MGVYVYTLRASRPAMVEGVGVVYRLDYLCRAGSLDDAFATGRRLTLLRNSMNRTRELFGDAPVNYVLGDVEEGAEVYRCDDASKVSVWYDFDRLHGEKVGTLGKRVRRGRRMVWTLEA